MPAIDGFTAKVFFDAERVVAGTRTLARQPERVAVLLARVQRLEVRDPDGQLLTSIAAGSLPAPAPALTTVPAPRPPAAKPAVDPAQAAKTRQQQVNAAGNDRMAAIKLRAQIAGDVQRETQLRTQACIQQAAKANPNQGSQAYQQAVDSCTRKAKQGAACLQQADQAGLSPVAPEYKQSVDACVQKAWQ
jgi:hypothetical protein